MELDKRFGTGDRHKVIGPIGGGNHKRHIIGPPEGDVERVLNLGGSEWVNKVYGAIGSKVK